MVPVGNCEAQPRGRCTAFQSEQLLVPNPALVAWLPTLLEGIRMPKGRLASDPLRAANRLLGEQPPWEDQRQTLLVAFPSYLHSHAAKAGSHGRPQRAGRVARLQFGPELLEALPQAGLGAEEPVQLCQLAMQLAKV
eukprot:6185272-Pleurochrysis_carterae.AAC.5